MPNFKIRRIIKAARQKQLIMYKKMSIGLSDDFLDGISRVKGSDTVYSKWQKENKQTKKQHKKNPYNHEYFNW